MVSAEEHRQYCDRESEVFTGMGLTVSLPGGVDGGVVVHASESGVARVSVSSAGGSALLDRVEAVPGRDGLESRRRGVALLKLLEDLLGLLGGCVGAERLELGSHDGEEGVHSERGESHGDGLGEEGEETTLVDGVVEDLGFEL
jgi:hypothetical protein